MYLTNSQNRVVQFEIESFGNGIAYQIIRKADGESVFLQGDDALWLGQELNRTSESVTDEDVVLQYFE